MKNSKSLVCGLALGLALLASASAKPTQDWSSWVENYYLNPEAEKVVPAVYALSRDGYFEQSGQPAAAIGFLGSVFAQNPTKVAGWMRDFRELPVEHRRLVAAAAWYAGVSHGADYVRDVARSSPADIRAEVESLITWQQPTLQDTPVLSRSSLNLQWGAFLASGDSKHVVNILAALGSTQPALSTASRVALAEKAMAHPRVYEICQAEIARQPAGVREQWSTALLGRTP